MRSQDQFYIGGQWVAPASGSVAQSFDVINSANEEVAGRIKLGSAADVDRAVTAARKALETYSRTPTPERAQLLRRIAVRFEERRSELAEAISEEIGCPAWLAQGGQLDMPLAHIQKSIEVLETFEFERLRAGTLIRREAIGVCGLITPWNWPVLTSITKIAPALATGCTVVWKPSEYSPFSAQILTEILHAAEVPPGVVNMLFGNGAEVGSAISSHVGVDMVSITGSTRAGIEVARSAAASVKRVHQELGGKSPNILLEDADFEKAVASCVRYVCINAGQNCTAPTRLIAPRSKMPEVVAIAKRTAEEMTVGPPAVGAFVGPVANAQQFHHIQRLIQTGIDEGAELVKGGPGRPDGLARGYFVRPTIFSAVSNNMAIAREEIFGPVLVIIPYDSVDDAVQIANDTPYGLAAYVHSRQIERARAVARRVRAGQLFINGDLNLLDLGAPFGGRKMSGNGREFGEAGFEAYTEEVSYIGYEPATVTN
jgi:aldehyde dehydrogenase (NAD+)